MRWKPNAEKVCPSGIKVNKEKWKLFESALFILSIICKINIGRVTIFEKKFFHDLKKSLCKKFVTFFSLMNPVTA